MSSVWENFLDLVRGYGNAREERLMGVLSGALSVVEKGIFDD